MKRILTLHMIIGEGVRLNIYVEDDKHTVYNLEMQVENYIHLPQRSRYYQRLKVLLSYFDGKPVESELALTINEEVMSARINIKWRREYMLLSVELLRQFKEERDAGHKIGIAEGRVEGCALKYT